VTFYNQWTTKTVNDPAAIQDFTSDKIIESIYWSGKYNPVNDKIDDSIV